MHWLLKTGQLTSEKMHNKHKAGIGKAASGTAFTYNGAHGNMKLTKAQQQELAVLYSGGDIIITSQGVYQKGPGGELTRVHGNSKLHPNHPRNKDGFVTQGLDMGAAVPAAAARVSKKAVVEAAQLAKQQAKQAQQSASIYAAVAVATTSATPLSDYANSFDNCTLFSSGYLNPQAGMNNKSAFDHRQVARCPVCDQPVAGARFAPHLERCLSGGKRSGLDLASLGGHHSGRAKASAPIGTVSTVRYSQDPHPHSAVVRIRINVSGATQGLPKVYQDREGVSAEEWERANAAASRR